MLSNIHLNLREITFECCYFPFKSYDRTQSHRRKSMCKPIRDYLFASVNYILITTRVQVFRIIPEFRIFRLTFPQKVSLKMLNYGDYNSFSDLFFSLS